jgi:uncharacterized membrane protein
MGVTAFCPAEAVTSNAAAVPSLLTASLFAAAGIRVVQGGPDPWTIFAVQGGIDHEDCLCFLSPSV